MAPISFVLPWNSLDEFKTLCLKRYDALLNDSAFANPALGPSLQLVLWENLAMQCHYIEACVARKSGSGSGTHSPNRLISSDSNAQYAAAAAVVADPYNCNAYPPPAAAYPATSPTTMTNLSGSGTSAAALFQNDDNRSSAVSRSPTVSLPGRDPVASGAPRSARPSHQHDSGQHSYIQPQQQNNIHPPLLIAPSRAPSRSETTIPNFANVHNTARSTSSGTPAVPAYRSTSSTPSSLSAFLLPAMPASTARSSSSSSSYAPMNAGASRPASRTASASGSSSTYHLSAPPSANYQAPSSSSGTQSVAHQPELTVSSMQDALSQTSALIDTLLSPTVNTGYAQLSQSSDMSILWNSNRLNRLASGAPLAEVQQPSGTLPPVTRPTSTSISTTALPAWKSASSPHSIQPFAEGLYTKSDLNINRPPSGPPGISTILPARSSSALSSLGISALDYHPSSSSSSYQPSPHYMSHAFPHPQSQGGRSLQIKTAQVKVKSPAKKISLTNLFSYHHDVEHEDDGASGVQDEEHDMLKLPPVPAYNAAGRRASQAYDAYPQNLLTMHAVYPQQALVHQPQHQHQQRRLSSHAAPVSARDSVAVPSEATQVPDGNLSASRTAQPESILPIYIQPSTIKPSNTIINPVSSIPAHSQQQLYGNPSYPSASSLTLNNASASSAQHKVSQFSSKPSSTTGTTASSLPFVAPTKIPRQPSLAQLRNSPIINGRNMNISVASASGASSIIPKAKDKEQAQPVPETQADQVPSAEKKKPSSRGKKASNRGGRGKGRATGTVSGKGRGRGKAGSKAAVDASSDPKENLEDSEAQFAVVLPAPPPPPHLQTLSKSTTARSNEVANKGNAVVVAKPAPRVSPTRRSSPKKRIYAEDGISDPEGEYNPFGDGSTSTNAEEVGSSSSEYVEMGMLYSARNLRKKRRLSDEKGRILNEKGQATAMRLELGLRSGSKGVDPAKLQRHPAKPKSKVEDNHAGTFNGVSHHKPEEKQAREEYDGSDSDLSPLPADYQDTSMEQDDMSFEHGQADLSTANHAEQQQRSGLVAAYAESEDAAEGIAQIQHEDRSMEQEEAENDEDDEDDEEEEDEGAEYHDASFHSNGYV